MAETVSDIIGKGFKYDEREKIKTIQEVLTGTIVAYAGGANWGPENVPTLVLKDFSSFFGNPITKDDNADFSGLSADYLLNYSPYCWFTRVANGGTEAQYQIMKAATVPTIIGSEVLADASFVIRDAADPYGGSGIKNDEILFEILYPGSGGGTADEVAVTLAATDACSPESSDVDFVSYLGIANFAAGNFSVGDKISFSIDDIDYRYIVKDEYGIALRDANEPDFLDLVISDEVAGNTTYSDPAPMTAGIQEIIDNGAVDIVGTTLVADAPGGYNLKINVDGAGLVEYNTGTMSTSSIQDALTALQVALRAGTGSTETIAIIDGKITVTSASVGTSSSIVITEGDSAGFIAALTAAITGTATIDTAVDGVDGTFWNAFTADADVNTYEERLAFAIRKWIIVPKLEAAPYSLDTGDAETLADILVTSETDIIKLNSTNKGTESSIKIFSFPKAYTATPLVPIVSVGANTDISIIVDAINTEIDSVAGAGVGAVSIDPQTYKFVFTTLVGGIEYGIGVKTVADDFYSELGLVQTDLTVGVDGIADAGLFKAYYKGTDGNSIIIEQVAGDGGDILTIYFNGFVVGTFFNYSYTIADTNYIGTMIADDTVTSKIVELIPPDSETEIPAFVYGTMQLSSGTSGVASISNTAYNLALEEYKNIDLYNIDIVCVSGHVAEVVQDKVDEVCAYRKDCFGVVDIPESAAGTKTIGGSIQKSIDWHNGVALSGRDNKLDSKFIAVYFPWMAIEDGTDNEESNWYPPSVRAIGAIAQSDKISGHQHAAPAGPNRTSLSNIHALAQYPREDQKNTLYADELENSINPIVFTTARGFYLDGQKNTDRNFMAISRHNVLRTSLYIKKAMYLISPDFFWSPLTQGTFDDLNAALLKIANYLSSTTVNAIKDDFTIITDAAINTELVEAQKGLIGAIEWTPIRSIEKIKVISVIRDLKVNVTLA